MCGGAKASFNDRVHFFFVTYEDQNNTKVGGKISTEAEILRHSRVIYFLVPAEFFGSLLFYHLER